MLQIIKFEWLTQTNCETQQDCSWVVPSWAVLDQLLANTHHDLQSGCIVYYTVYMDILV